MAQYFKEKRDIFADPAFGGMLYCFPNSLVFRTRLLENSIERLRYRVEFQIGKSFMQWLNYHHLLYFWTVAREGSIVQACKKLHLAQPTISGQLKLLEQTLGEKLFERRGRGLVMTEVGQIVYRYAEQIFGLGNELLETVKGNPTRRPLVVGIVDVLPKLIAYRLLEPARKLAEPVKMICREDRPEALVAELALHKLDIVLSDAPISTGSHVKAYSHLLGESGITFYAVSKLAKKLRKNFPRSLDGVNMLLPGEQTALRGSLEAWFSAQKIQPHVVAEFADSALMSIFGEAGDGVFPALSVLERDLKKQGGIEAVGRISSIRERFYVLSVERKLKHPAAIAISRGAKTELFKVS